MPFLLAVVGVVVAVLYFVLRAHGTAKALREVNRDTKHLQHRAKSVIRDVIGTPLERVRDVRLAAVILMIQMVRTGSPVAATEKAQILSLMASPLEIEDADAVFERAWGYTQPRLPFSLVADPLTPLLRQALTPTERGELCEMLTKVASAHSPPSELQREAVVRLKRRLMAPEPGLAGGRAGDLI